MSQPKDVSFDDIKPNAPIEPSETKQQVSNSVTPPLPEPNQTNPSSPHHYANRFAAQKYHPVVLIGSAAAGKTVLLSSLLAFFKTHANESKLSIFFGDDFYRQSDSVLRDPAERYFDRTVADFINGTADTATRIGAPMFIPVKVSGESRPELKFAFMESDGEWFQPDRRPDARFTVPFKPELEALLRQFPDGISFIWVAPHMPEIVGSGAMANAEELMQQANESLQGALRNYEALRRNNAARDHHMFLVSKWDTHFSETAPADIRLNLGRDQDERIGHEVENFILKTYSGAYGTFQALNSPPSNKVVFRYSAGLFSSRTKGVGVEDEVLRTYPRDVWNWLYRGMREGHDWNFAPGPLIPKPGAPKKSLLQMWDELVASILG
jgi:hypothetical protein